MKKLITLIAVLTLFSCAKEDTGRIVENFNDNWKFSLNQKGDFSNAKTKDTSWQTLNVPHDWSIEKGYQKDGKTAASTGFSVGGIGWYRKHFTLKKSDKNKEISILFDGVYNNSNVWINGHFLGKRPNGYNSFSYDLSKHLNYDGSDNVIAVKVDRKAYADSRWYTGSGIYRKVRLIKKSPINIAQWGVQITTPEVSSNTAKINIKTTIKSDGKADNNLSLNYSILDENGSEIASEKSILGDKFKIISKEIKIQNPKLWSTEKGNLYTLTVSLFKNDKLIDNTSEKFGIRTFKFTADKGFFLNGKKLKIKGVNLHHDAGAVGAAVPKGIWEYRVKKLKSIGVNAVRFAHNPHSKELLEVCDEQGILVMNEAFDEWNVPKLKSKKYLGDNAATKESSKAYPASFNEWAERDLKDLIRRDFNHPSVFMWSIGNEIEWTFPHYSKTYNDVNGSSGAQGYEQVPNYDYKTVKTAFDKNIDGEDPLVKIAKQLVAWVKEEDTTRPVTCGSVLPSVGMVSGYGTAVDVYGYNYRAADYDAAHKEYPNLKILGSENWGSYNEWKSINERDFVSGIFVWTGFAYLGEAGPWPRKGLNISFFDFAGFKTPRGHFYETLWIEKPKVYMVTTPAKESEFSFHKKEGWKFDMQLTAPPVWNMLRKWEWYKVNSKWKYKTDEEIVVQAYTNCEEAELFLNNVSLGKQKLADVIETDHILKWLVPYKNGELKIVGYNKGKKVDEYFLNTHNDKVAKIDISSTKQTLKADGTDVSVITIKLLDKNGNLIIDADKEVTFKLSGPAKNIGIDNGWEMNTQSHKSNSTITHNGKAILIVQATKERGEIKVSATSSTVKSKDLKISAE
ncbi:glycosyl hydrolase family 2 [Polaribacter reichenbachii]|uniref:Glycosyl hydrolase family 2 n=1 Tax=Polaribacter reichenbachii TaxID=996801 RepID=A0A1B8TVA2_9FLAO|nr:sugar-binding domain-containing protein [Polaribacter reichenbachii]APZ45483.1 glycosyl hydrolase family 2 [Polaribacter reichenbachii]AUC19344.1 glycosyl hydrolase family 2 [Polaribacter reichenbachii]OBY63502.1 glycosyl hydrolase family 2 [Polaribacter reichenbachii]